MDFVESFERLARNPPVYPRCLLPFPPQTMSAVSTRKRYPRSRVRRDPGRIKQMVKTTNPEITRRIRVFVSSLEGFISQGKPWVTFFFWEGTAHMRDGARKSSRQ